MGGGGSCFCVNFFRLTVPKTFVREAFCVSKKMVSKIFMHRRRGASCFCGNVFVSEDRKIL